MGAKTFDLSGLSLGPGVYRIQATAAADGYRESDLSSAVSYQVGYKLDVSYSKGEYDSPAYVGYSGQFTITLTPNPGEALPKAGDITATGAEVVGYESLGSSVRLTLANQTGAVAVYVGSGAADPVVSADEKLMVSWDARPLWYNPRIGE